VREADAVLIVGTYVFPEVFPLLGDVFAADAKVVHVDLNAYEIAKNHRVDLGLVSDPMPTLAALADRLMAVLGPNDLAAARERISAIGAKSAATRDALLERDAARRHDVPLRASTFMEALARHAPDDTIVFDEALTVSPDVTRYLVPRSPTTSSRRAAARWASASPGRSASRWRSPTRPSSASPATAAACTRSRRCGRPPITASARSS
jgi:thiamine pyrophosphate-dependent acetolactate synthase large subunit-like protein